MSRGLFISFEGPDGSGKSTQARLLATWMSAQGYDVMPTREPGGTALGDRLRHLLLDPSSPPATPLSMGLMYSASRAELVDEVIWPALERGQVVIVDRYADSTIAYQGYAGQIGISVARQLAEIATRGLWPDITIYVDVSPEIGLARIRARGRSDRLDAETIEFHRRVRAAYCEMMVQEPHRWIRIDGSLAPEEVEVAIQNALAPRLEAVGSQ